MAVSLHRPGRRITPVAEEGALIRSLSRFGSEEDGVDMIEYACIIGFLALAGFLAMTQLSTTLGGFFASISNRLPSVLP